MKTVTISSLGHRGDGIAIMDGAEVFVPFTLPQETVAVVEENDRSTPAAIVDASPHRVTPFCPWFGRCGGCALQHADRTFELEWKRGLVVEAMQHRGLSASVGSCIDAHGAGRRRVTLHVRHTDDGVQAGFMAARSHALVAIDQCPLLVPDLKMAPPIAAAIGRILAGKRKPLDVQITQAQEGLDVDVRGAGEIAQNLRQQLVAFADERKLVRLSLHGELIFARQPPTVMMGDARVEIPAGGFLQATATAEDILAKEIIAALGKARAVLDLFSGCGPFTFRMARQAKVHAVEVDKASIAALLKAVRHTQGLKPVTAEVRDLYRRPMLAAEMAGYDAVLFDPPRNGAEMQARELAKPNKVRTVVAVSCNPATFARDARILCDGGWRIEAVTPVDQFRHAAHVELIAVFRR